MTYITVFFQFAPELVLVSAGFDAAAGDPLVSTMSTGINLDIVLK
jgi:acetoin utilization deacetylase AcuC-like enzyme